MLRGFKYRFYPTPDQEKILARTFGGVRFVYNWALNVRSQAWREDGERLNYESTSAALTLLKRRRETAWLNEISCIPTQQCLRHLHRAFVNFWTKRGAYPTFKRKRDHQSAEFTRSGFRWQHGTLSLAKIGVLRIRWSRRFVGNPSTVTVSKTRAGRYYIAFQVNEPLQGMPVTTAAIGIDLGLTAFATASTTLKFHAPRPLRCKMAQLKCAHKALARKQRGSKNWDKARLRLAKIHQRISDVRKDFLHKLTTRIVRENQTIVIEDLAIRDMMANHALAGAISDVGWGEFARQLDYKARWYDRELIRIDRYYPSSRRCSNCGEIAESLPLELRRWQCHSCGCAHDRDINAAINILTAGQAVIACGESARPSRRQRRHGNSR